MTLVPPLTSKSAVSISAPKPAATSVKPQATPPKAAPRDTFEAAPLQTSRSVFAGERRTRVEAPLTLELPAEAGPKGTARLTLPASAFLVDPKTASIELGKPWSDVKPKVTVDGDRVQLEIPGADLNAFAKLSPAFQIRYPGGRAELMVVNSKVINVDETVNQRTLIEHNISTAHTVIDDLSGWLAEAKRGPKPPQLQPDLDAAIARRDAATGAREAARPAITERVKNAGSIDLVLMGGSDALASLRQDLIAKHNAALGGDPAKVAAESSAAAALRSAILQSDDRLAGADWANNQLGPFASAARELKSASREVAMLSESVANERTRNAEDQQQAIAGYSEQIADWKGRLAGFEKQLGELGQVVRQLPTEQIDLAR